MYVYLDELPWSYPLDMNYLFCNEIAFKKCIKNYPMLKNSVGRKSKIEAGKSIAGVVSMKRLLGDRWNSDVSVAAWGYRFRYVEQKNKYHKDFTGMCHRSVSEVEAKKRQNS